MKAVLFKSDERFKAFQKKLAENKIDFDLLDFEKQDWVSYDYSNVDIVIYYSSFKYSSNHPLALQEVYDNLIFLHREYPHLCIFPDPNGIHYYNDKYRQYLFLRKNRFSIPETIPLFSKSSMDIAEKQLGYPMVIKNRYGAGGGSVFRVANRKELTKLYNLSTLNLFNKGSLNHFFQMMRKRIFYYYLIKEKRCLYPFLSAPLMAQKYIKIDRDLKTVIGDGKVVEAHWRHQAHPEQWKVNIDDGGIGVWAYVPEEPLSMSERLAKELNTRWLNIDMLTDGKKYYITEFSPVWHHYAYKEKPSFVYQDDYNIDVPLEVSLDLEKILVESLAAAAKKQRK
jgi:glutathione synthase/RimK-type ligase-like ATP-grasp enzyme